MTVAPTSHGAPTLCHAFLALLHLMLTYEESPMIRPNLQMMQLRLTEEKQCILGLLARLEQLQVLSQFDSKTLCIYRGVTKCFRHHCKKLGEEKGGRSKRRLQY